MQTSTPNPPELPPVHTYQGDCLSVIPRLTRLLQFRRRVHCVVTSPPYWSQRIYGDDTSGLGREPTPAAYISAVVARIDALKPLLHSTATVWLNLGDTRIARTRIRRPAPDLAIPPGSLAGIPWRVASALQALGWAVQSEIVWHKPNATPGAASCRPRPNHEILFMLTPPLSPDSSPPKTHQHFYDAFAVLQPGVTIPTTNLRTVWTIPTNHRSVAHFAPFPPALVTRCLQASVSAGGCCPSCAAPILRITESVRKETRPGRRSKTIGQPPAHTGNRDAPRHVTTYQHKGWTPSCSCPDLQTQAPSPCLVLDPFAGSGTTALAARDLGHSTILIDTQPIPPLSAPA